MRGPIVVAAGVAALAGVASASPGAAPVIVDCTTHTAFVDLDRGRLTVIFAARGLRASEGTLGVVVDRFGGSVRDRSRCRPATAAPRRDQAPWVPPYRATSRFQFMCEADNEWDEETGWKTGSVRIVLRRLESGATRFVLARGSTTALVATVGGKGGGTVSWTPGYCYRTHW